MRTLRYVVVDVFTDRALEGNQLAVFTDARELDAADMQALARELKFSESTFVLPPEQGGHAKMRIFTPVTELPFAGHPTLGTAFVLGGPLQAAELNLETGNGIVTVALERDDGGRITFGRMEQPLPKIEPYEGEEELLAALGVKRSRAAGRAVRQRHAPRLRRSRLRGAGSSLEAGLHAPLELPPVLGINCFAGSGKRWKTRMFAPAAGVAEDPATGSAAGPLALHLARHGRISFGDEIEISQGAEIKRPSTLYARVEGNADEVERVEVGGSAVTVARGEFRL